MRRLYPEDADQLLEKMNDFDFIRRNMPKGFMQGEDVERYIQEEYVFAIASKEGTILALVSDEYYNEVARSGLIKFKLFNGKQEEINEAIRLYKQYCFRTGNYDILYVFVPEYEEKIKTALEYNEFKLTGRLPDAKVFNRKKWDEEIYYIKVEQTSE